MDWPAREIVVELASTRKKKPNDSGVPEDYGPTNTYVHVRAFATNFRGRWSLLGMGGASASYGYSAMPTIPGIHICVNEKKKTIRAIDPCGFPENEQLLATVNAIREASPENVRSRPWDDHIIDNASETELKSVLFELREFVDDDQAVVQSGTLPEAKEVLAMPGDLNRRIYSTVAERDGTVPPVHLREGELERLGQPQNSRVKIVPAKAGA